MSNLTNQFVCLMCVVLFVSSPYTGGRVSSAAGDTASAQFPRSVRRSLEPTSWVDFMAGLTQGFDIDDGSTGSTWQFGSGVQYQVALEKTVTGFVHSGLVDSITAYTWSFSELASSANALDDATSAAPRRKGRRSFMAAPLSCPSRRSSACRRLRRRTK